MRKIVQITTVPVTFFGITVDFRQHALCDDGTLWYRLTTNKDSHWRYVDDLIPEDK